MFARRIDLSISLFGTIALVSRTDCVAIRRVVRASLNIKRIAYRGVSRFGHLRTLGGFSKRKIKHDSNGDRRKPTLDGLSARYYEHLHLEKLLPLTAAIRRFRREFSRCVLPCCGVPAKFKCRVIGIHERYVKWESQDARYHRH